MPSMRCERSPSCFLLILYTLLPDRLVRFVKRPRSNARMKSRAKSCVKTAYKIISGFSNAIRVMADRFLARFLGGYFPTYLASILPNLNALYYFKHIDLIDVGTLTPILATRPKRIIRPSLKVRQNLGLA